MRADRGQKRSSYNMMWRAMKKMIADAVRTAKAEEKTTRERVSRSRKDRRKDRRLKALPADMRCPQCNKVVLESRRWVITDEGSLCLSCHRKNSK